MRIVYHLLITVTLPFALLRLLWRSRKNPDYRKRIGERLTLNFSAPGQAIWIHAVSVGEFLATLPLIEALLAENKTLRIATATPTGSALVKEKLGERVSHQYLPFDLSFFAARFVVHHRPQLAVFIETEIWPNFLSALKKNDIPALLINARLSQRSFNGYKKLGRFGSDTVAQFAAVHCQNEASRARFEALGAKADNLGNIKFDIQPPADLAEKQVIVAEKTQGRAFILVASTHQGEEEIILEQFQKSAETRLLVIAPRHPERAAATVALAEKMGYKPCRYHQCTAVPDACDVMIIDGLGLLLPFYSLADYAIIGGSFIAHGGHNPLEAALFATPCLIGKHYFNFDSLINEMLNENAIAVIPQTALFNTEPDKVQGQNAKRFLANNQGATKKYLARITAHL